MLLYFLLYVLSLWETYSSILRHSAGNALKYTGTNCNTNHLGSITFASTAKHKSIFHKTQQRLSHSTTLMDGLNNIVKHKHAYNPILERIGISTLNVETEILLKQFAKRILEDALIEHGYKTESPKINLFELEQQLKTNQVAMTKKGVFITLWHNGNLRGCVGTWNQHKTILENLKEYTLEAAFNDERFTYDDPKELLDVTIEITILSDLIPITVDDWDIDNDGIIIEKGKQRGIVLLSATRDIFRYYDDQQKRKVAILEKLATEKAGLPNDCWENAWKETSGDMVRLYAVPQYEF